MALGKPVIASRIGGLREAIKHGENGFLITPGNVNEIEQHWRQLLEDTVLRDRLGKAAKATVYSEYLIDDKVESLANIWKQMAEKK
jgi:glycosyltransferase involved in cell wall biosynthesis